MSSNRARTQALLKSQARPTETAKILDAVTRQAREAMRQQAAAVAAVGERLDHRFTRAARLLFETSGHVVVIGLGKSGHVGRKLAATLASTGTPSFFVHAAEALHGDLGMITEHDTALLVSYSGSTAEVVELLPHLRARQVPTVALVGVMTSRLATEVDIALDVSVPRETCPHNLAPTTSTLATAAMGDALAIAVMRMRAFAEEEFARVHPGGSLGRRLARVGDVVSGDSLVFVAADSLLSDCMIALAGAETSVALVRDDAGRIVGMITPVELQRAVSSVEGWLRASVSEIMERTVPTIEGSTLVQEARERMEREGVPALVVVDEDGVPYGVLSARTKTA